MKPTDDQLVALRCASAEGPLTLGEADVTKPFVYDREYGFFYVNSCWHGEVMELLLAFHHGCKNEKEISEKLKYRRHCGVGADLFIQTVSGTAYLSSCAKSIQACKKNLTPSERKFFGDIDYLEDLCCCSSDKL